MAKLRLELMTNGYDEPPINCGVGSIQRMIAVAYDLVRMKQAIVYNLTFEEKILGQIMLSINWIRDYDHETNVGSNVFACLYIRYIAIDKAFQEQGLGNCLLKFAIQFYEEHCNILPIRCIAFEALRDRVEWYTRHGFKRFSESMALPGDNPGIIPMYMDFVDMDAFDDEFLDP